MAAEIQVRPAPAGTLPVCPGCKKELDHVLETPLKPPAARASLFFAKFGPRALICPHCRVWLGQTQ